MKRRFAVTVLATLFSLFFVMNGSAQENMVTVFRSDTANVAVPDADGGKLPAVFFVHNGGAKKEDWGDFLEKLAANGYLTVSIGWTAFAGYEDVGGVIKSVLKTFGTRIDTGRVAYVGGCHGGVKLVPLMSGTAVPCTVKTAVFLSVSEPITLPENHVPILGFYSVNDRLGAYYRSFTKRLVEETITQPKKAVAFDGTPHGNELVTDDASRESVRNEIVSWLEKYL